jgi:hypothetical protein
LEEKARCAIKAIESLSTPERPALVILDTRSMHPVFTGQHDRRKGRSPISQNLYNDNYERMQQEADAVIIVKRNECNHREINKMWADYIDDFPADKSHADVLAGLEESADRKVATEPKTGNIVVGYVDRQNTQRTMPPSEHEFLVGFLTNHPMVGFLHLHGIVDALSPWTSDSPPMFQQWH